MVKDASATRERLIAAARKAFCQRGYAATTVREIAADAGVNPALINRYFGGKEQLFIDSVAIDLKFPDLGAVPRGEVGRTLLWHFFERWEGSEEDDHLRVLIRTAVTNAEAAERMRIILSTQVTSTIAKRVSPDRASERACLVATQILGLAYARFILGFSDQQISRDVMVAMIGATIERYLFDRLPEFPAGPASDRGVGRASCSNA